MYLNQKGVQITQTKNCLFELEKLKIIGCDTETIGTFYDGDVYTLQLGNKHNQYVIDCDSTDIADYKELLEREDKTFLFHNSKYDLCFFYAKGIRPKNIVDTFLNECILTTGMENRELGLKSVAYKYCGAMLDKSIRGKINQLGLVPEVVDYAAEDVVWLESIAEKQFEEMQRLELLEVAELENEVVKCFAEMEYNGFKLDVKMWHDVLEITKQEVKQRVAVLDDYVMKNSKLQRMARISMQQTLFGVETRAVNINYNSPAQVKRMFEAVGVPLASTSEDAISEIAHRTPLASYILDIREKQSQVSKYGLKFLKYVQKDGKTHTSFWQILETGRVSSKDPNMQNLPAKTKHRNCFIATEGWSLCFADYSGQELILMAEDAKEKVWIDATLNGYDLHSMTAELVFGDDWRKATEPGCIFAESKLKCNCKGHMLMRDQAKTVTYGLGYGAGPPKIGKTLKISVQRAKEIINRYFARLSTVDKYLKSVHNFALKNFIVRTFRPYRRIRFFEKTTDERELASIKRQAGNTRIQGTGADMMKLALVELMRVRDSNNYPVKFILQVHDEAITEVRDDFAEEWKQIKSDVMVQVSKKFLNILTIPVDAKLSKYWKK